MSNLPYFTLVRHMAGQLLTTTCLENTMNDLEDIYAHDLSDGYQLDESEESYRRYRQSLRYELDFYLNEIDPWLIPIQRAFIISLLLTVLFH